MAQSPYFERAAEALTRAMTASSITQRGQLLDESLRFNRLALAEEHEKRLVSTSWQALRESRALLERAAEILSESF